MQVLDKLKTLDRTKGRDHYDEMWAIIRALAVLDWRITSDRSVNEAGVAKYMEQYKLITANIRELAELILDEQSSPSKELVVH